VSYTLIIAVALCPNLFFSNQITGGTETRAIRSFSFFKDILTNILLGATLNSSFDRLTDWLVIRYGLGYFDYLALQGSNAASGYFRIIFGRQRRRGEQVRGRAFGTLRLIAYTVPPLLGFLAMSK
jgi:hypothetical protein